MAIIKCTHSTIGLSMLLKRWSKSLDVDWMSINSFTKQTVDYVLLTRITWYIFICNPLTRGNETTIFSFYLSHEPAVVL